VGEAAALALCVEHDGEFGEEKENVLRSRLVGSRTIVRDKVIVLVPLMLLHSLLWER
jgi:hypothetical protein